MKEVNIATNTMAPHPHLPTLDAADIVDMIENRPPRPAPLHYQTHAVAGNTLGKLLRRIPPATKWIQRAELQTSIRLMGHLLYFRYAGRSGFFVLAHVQEAHVGPQNRLILTMRNGIAKPLPPLCRPHALANLINALIDGTIRHDTALRPSCHTCIKLDGQLSCTLRPNPLPPSPCCPNDPNTDWCPNHKPAQREAPLPITPVP